MVRAHQILPQRGDHSIRAGAAGAAAETRVAAETGVVGGECRSEDGSTARGVTVGGVTVGGGSSWVW